ncbi:MAG: hypothetical protein AseanaTS_17260 [Candidatus Pelagadaptatus aseana]
MEQEIVDIERSILMHKTTLAELLASKSQLARESDTVKALIQKREGQARRLISDEESSDLLEDVVREIADQEMILEKLAQSCSGIERRILKLEGTLNKAVLEVANYRRELRVARALHINGHSLPKQVGLTQHFSQLKETHARLVGVQEYKEDCDEAWGEMSSRLEGKSLDARLEAVDQSDHQIRIQQIHKRLKIEAGQT